MKIYLIILLFLYSYTGNAETYKSCQYKFNKCYEKCEKKHKQVKKDIYGKHIKESDTNIKAKKICTDKCNYSKKYCDKRISRSNDTIEYNTENDYNIDNNNSTFIQDESNSSNNSYNKIYKYKDSNNKLHIVDNINKVPVEYRDQINN